MQIEFDPEVTQYTYGLVLNGISEEYGAVASVSEIRNIPSDIKILDFSQCYVETVPDISNCNSLTDVYLGADEIIYSTYDSGESTFLENLRTLCEEYISTYGSADDFTLYLDLNNCYYMGEAFEMLDLYGFVEVDERELTEEEYYFNYTEDNYFAIFKYQG